MFDKSFEYANLSNLVFIEKIYRQFLEDPSSVEPSWSYFFQGIELASSLNRLSFHETATSETVQSILPLIEAYRNYGHLEALINPLENSQQDLAYLDLKQLGLSSENLDQDYDTFGILPEKKAKLSLIIDRLKQIYCASIGIEVLHLDKQKKDYITSELERENNNHFSVEEKKEILEHLNRSEIFESFIHLKHPGQKRFSLEGGESLIPLMHKVIEVSSELNVNECVIGMAHRGRLNVLTNLMKKSYGDVFEEFSPGYIPPNIEGSGDVKYHKGYSSVLTSKKGLSVKIDLCPNPSHLESVDPVLEGIVKGKQLKSKFENSVMPIMIHGDASVAGQGVVYEVLQMSQLEGYSTGGTLHIVINNQVGFTATAKEGRSTRYCSDIGKGFGSPIFHVNGDDPEACVYVGELASKIRSKFECDVFIDLICYRKYGHSEGDEPLFTQPNFYQKIQKKENVRNLYKKRLLEQQVLSESEAGLLEKEFRDLLDLASFQVDKVSQNQSNPPVDRQKTEKTEVLVSTAINEEDLLALTEQFCKMPSDLKINSKVEKVFTERLNAVQKKEGIDWGLAEYLAYASLLKEGHPVRISGEDCTRGTFAHRHAAIVDQETEEKYFPLAHIAKKENLFTVYNSLLSEYAVLGFEFGYAQIFLEGLTIWEAQFGDFANGAQIIIDQYISSSEQKWGVKSPIVLMMPHGNEGQGPEHTSGRLERFLQLAAQSNMKIVVPSCPSQLFHILRLQVLEQSGRPLILFNPKGLLRYAPSLSHLDELSQGLFQKVIVDEKHVQATTLFLCSGKVYYDLIQEREKRKADDVAIVRIEQLYPLDQGNLKNILQKYKNLSRCCWVQEEHKNMGPYEYIDPLLREILPDNLKLCYVGRARSASPATGSAAIHQKEKEQFLKEAFG